MDKELCPVRCLKFYLKCTNALRLRHINTRLFICTCEPFGPATLQTISRWVKEIILKAGINMENVNKVNFRSASTSRAYSMGVSLTTIMNRAGWSRGSTFTRHYLKNIERRDPTKSSKKQIVDDLIRSTTNPFLTCGKGGRGLDAGRKVKKFAQLWSRDASILATSTPASSVADMSEVIEGSVEFISDGSFLSTSSVYLNESKNLDTSLQMNSSLEEPVVRNLVLPQSDHDSHCNTRQFGKQ